MRLIYYEEEQNLKSNQWLYVLMLVLTMAAMLPLIHGIYLQVIKGEPWGDSPLTNEGIIALAFIIFLICCITTWIFICMKLHVIIDTEGVHYRFFPNHPKWSTIRKEEIIDFDVEKKSIFLRLVHHTKWFVKSKTLNVDGPFHLSLFLKNGRKLQLGSHNPEGLRWAMKKLIPKNELI